MFLSSLTLPDCYFGAGHYWALILQVITLCTKNDLAMCD